MNLKQISKWVTITGTLVIWSVKFVIRPLQPHEEAGRFLLNIAPNLLGSFLIPFGAFWFFSGRNFLLARIFKIETAYDLRQVCVLGFGMLVVNEYLQRIPFFGRTFDYFDILFSAAGLVVSYFCFEQFRSRYQQTFEVQAG